MAAALFLVAVSLYMAGTLARNRIWRDDFTFWSDVVKKSPEGAVPHYNLGTVLAAQGRLDEAIAQYSIAIGLKPAAVAYKSLGAAYASKGLREKAVEAYLSALNLEPDDISTHKELGGVYGDTGALDKAIGEFEAALRLQQALPMFDTTLPRPTWRRGASAMSSCSSRLPHDWILPIRALVPCWTALNGRTPGRTGNRHVAGAAGQEDC